MYIWSTVNTFVPSINPIYTGEKKAFSLEEKRMLTFFFFFFFLPSRVPQGQALLVRVV